MQVTIRPTPGADSLAFNLDPRKSYTILKARFLPALGAKVTESPNTHHLGKDEAGFSIAWFALAPGESYCWRCAAIVTRADVKNDICPVCGGNFDD